MELVVERFLYTPEYTVSRLYEKQGRKYFVLDVLEPPLAHRAEDDGRPTAMPKGTYRLSLKSDRERGELAAVLRRGRRGPRMGLADLDDPLLLEKADFGDGARLYDLPLRCGRLVGKKAMIRNGEHFNRLMIRMIVAVQQKEQIIINFKN